MQLRWIFGKVLVKAMQNSIPMDNLGEQKVLESAFFRLSKSLKFKILAMMVPPPDILGLLPTFTFELQAGVTAN